MFKKNRVTLKNHYASDDIINEHGFQFTGEKLTSIMVMNNVDGLSEMDLALLKEFCSRAMVESYDELDTLVNDAEFVYGDAELQSYNLQHQIFQFEQFQLKVLEAFYNKI